MAKDDIELIHNFAHDLKTPLSAAKSFLDLLEASGDLNEQQQHFAHRAQSNLMRMFGTIDALLEYARMEDDDLETDVVDLLEVIEEVHDMIESTAEAREVTLHINVDPDAQFVEADEHMIEHVLSNLISNAIKYNRLNGDVYIETADAGGYVRVSVRDTGLGIPQNAMGRIFERFFRVDTKQHRSVEGTGIGLAVVKGVIDKHGGDLTVDSKEGTGSTFAFTLPRANTSSPDYNREPTDGLDDHFQEGRDDRDDSDAGDLH